MATAVRSRTEHPTIRGYAPRVATRSEGPRGEFPLWKTLAILLVGLAFLIAAEIALAFSVAYLLTGRAY
jgi:hypothetical protein